MTKEELISAFDDLGHLAAIDTAELADLVEENPCSGMLRMLYVKTLKEGDDIRFEHEMRSAAAHLPMRAKLYNWLKRPSLVDSSVSSSEVSGADHTTIDRLQVVDMEKGVVQGSYDDSAVAEESQDKGGTENAAEKIDLLRDLERQYLTEAVEVSIGMEVEAEMDQLSDDEPQRQVDIIQSDLTHSTSDEVSADFEKDTHTFLDFISGASEAPSSSLVGDKKPTSHNEGKEENSLSDSLIARFISNEKREKVKFFDPVRMAKASLVDNEELVTETLARVYQHQGNYKKALRAYESLQLKYPEKRLYFAGRIERLNELIKNRKHS